MATHGEMLEHVRKNIVGRDRAHVRRARRFDVDIVDPMVTRDSRFVAPEAFFGIYDRVVRPMFERAIHCRVFYDLARRAALHKVDQASAQAIQARGGDSESWCETYLDFAVDGEATVQRSPAALEDRLFWWWVMLRPAGLRPVFVLPNGQLDSAAFFRETYDPGFVKWSFGPKAAVMRAFRFAKEVTASGEAVAFIPMHWKSLEVVARTTEVDQLFSEAARNCRISELRWARS